MKRWLTYGLLTLAVVGVGFAVKNRLTSTGAESIAANRAGEAGDFSTLPDNCVVLTYFTTNFCCPSCYQIEDLIRRTLETRFAEELASGTLVFRTINFDQPGNRHYVNDYQLVSKTVIVSRREGGQETGWNNLQEVWMKLSSPADFQAYIAAKVEASLKPSHSSGA